MRVVKSVFLCLLFVLYHVSIVPNQHIEYLLAKIPLIATLLTTAKYHLEWTTKWNNRQKNIAYYVNQIIELCYSQAGISPSIKPGLPHLPSVSLTQVEYAHLMFHHIFTRACQSVKDTFNRFNTNDKIEKIINKIWYYCVQKCKHRAKDCSRSNLRDSSEGKQVSLKTLQTYRSAFEMAVNGHVCGFGSLELSILRRIIEWNGKWFCDTWNENLVEWLIENCHEIIIQIDNTDSMTHFNDRTPCLRTWLNMIDVNAYWFSNANTFMGLKYEGQNKHSKGDLQASGNVVVDTLLVNHTAKKRLIKDMFAQAMTCPEIPLGQKLGRGITKIIKNAKHAVSPLQKLLTYECHLQSDEIQWVPSSDFINPFIIHSVPKKIQPSAWINLINYNNNNALRFSEAGKKAAKTMWQMTFILNQILMFQPNFDLTTISKQLQMALANNIVSISELVGISTFYRTWSDSVIKTGDTVYTRHSNYDDQIVRINHLYKINGLNEFADKFNLQMNPNFTNHWECIIIAVANRWKLKYPNQNGFNYQQYSFHDSPSLYLSNCTKVINVEWIVQQCYVAHDHILPSKADQIGMNKTISEWPINDNCNFPVCRNESLLIDIDDNKLPYCGVGWCCKQHLKVNCNPCIQDDLTNNGCILYECKQELWPYYKVYTIYQGYIPRLFNARTINELGW